MIPNHSAFASMCLCNFICSQHTRLKTARNQNMKFYALRTAASIKITLCETAHLVEQNIWQTKEISQTKSRATPIILLFQQANRVAKDSDSWMEIQSILIYVHIELICHLYVCITTVNLLRRCRRANKHSLSTRWLFRTQNKIGINRN